MPIPSEPKQIPELKPKQMVPVPGHPVHLIEYLKLTLYEQKRREYFEELIGNEVVKFRVSQLLDGVDLSRQSRRTPARTTAVPPLKLF